MLKAIRLLLPPVQGYIWWREVYSTLAECDQRSRAGIAWSYVRAAPRTIWTSSSIETQHVLKKVSE